ncbi:hypothetical protein BKA93DRAFT_735508 [Sparassis latifolia]
MQTFTTLQHSDIVGLNETGIKAAAKYIYERIQLESYTPRSWRTHPLHLCPHEPYAPDDPSTRECFDWLFLISSLNFSFWSEKEGQTDRYGVEWRAGWSLEERVVHTGYWSLVAAVDRALEEGIPLTDPAFYSSEILCPDSLLVHVFRPAPQSSEGIPLLKERIAILREVGNILCTHFSGSFYGFYQEFHRVNDGRGTALQLVQMVAETFPSFRDEFVYEGRKICIWKRAQILVAETWAAFYPCSSSPHPLFPQGSAIHQLTMFADYRLPQILHHLQILTYPPSLKKLLEAHTMLASGSRVELSIRAASIMAVERMKEEIVVLCGGKKNQKREGLSQDINSVLIDFYLWNLAKRIESDEESISKIETNQMLPIHRTRSLWY